MSTTTNLGMTVPTVGADSDVWGDELNADLALIDAAFTRHSATLNGTTPTGTTSATGVMMGLGTTLALTMVKTKARIKAYGYINTLGTAAPILKARYGTGSAPANAAAFTGTVFNATGLKFDTLQASNIPFYYEEEVTGLTPTTAYWFDFDLIAGSTGAVTLTICRARVEEFYV